METVNAKKGSVHKILAHSYGMHFVLFLMGVVLDLIFKLQFFSNPLIVYKGIVLLVFGSLLIIWAQYTSRNLKVENVTKETFCNGPYRFTRTPTNFGLFFMMFGFGLMLNALFIMITSIISFVVAKFVFLNKEEELLALKYGAPYLEYKKSVKF